MMIDDKPRGRQRRVHEIVEGYDGPDPAEREEGHVICQVAEGLTYWERQVQPLTGKPIWVEVGEYLPKPPKRRCKETLELDLEEVER